MESPTDSIIDLDDRPDGFAPWDGRRVPVTLLGGYLGVGKTTLLNELLARTDQPVAVLVNDVGAINIDASLIARRHGDTIELTDGCVCCSIGNDLGDALDQLRRRATPPEHVVIELSGVAEPARVIPWAKSDGFRLDGVVVLVDCDQFEERLDDPLLAPVIETQLAAADVVVLTKIDLASPQSIGSVRVRLTELAPDTPVFSAESIPAGAAFLDLATRRPGGVEQTPTPSLFDVHETALIPMADPMPLEQLRRLIDDLDPDVLRAKGVARVEDGTLHLVQVVGRRRSIEPLPNAEGQPATDLVVITPRR